MIKAVLTITFIGATLQAQVAVQPPNTITASANPVVQWNRNLLAIVGRTTRDHSSDAQLRHDACSDL